VALGVGLLGALSLVSLEPPPPDPAAAPSPSPVGTSLPVEANRLARELEEAQFQRLDEANRAGLPLAEVLRGELLDSDPALWTARTRRLPRLRAALTWLSGLGPQDRATPAQLEELARGDRLFLRLGLEPPFAARIEAWRRPGQEALEATLQEYRRQRDELRTWLLEAPPGELPAPLRDPTRTWRMLSGGRFGPRAGDLADLFAPIPARRAALAELLRARCPALRVVLTQIDQALRTGPPSPSLQEAALSVAAEDILYFLSAAGFLELEALAGEGGPARSSPLLAVALGGLRVRVTLALGAEEEAERQAGEVLAAFRRVPAPSLAALPAAPSLRDFCEGFRTLLRLFGSPNDAVALANLTLPVLGSRADEASAAALRFVLEAILGCRGRDEVGLAAARRVLDRLRALHRARPDLEDPAFHLARLEREVAEASPGHPGR